ncbi:hypothetical protein RJ639_001869 [Escallonia herrerae]|uniref:Reverse transcriptase Ty1/copia-type domain-containing protein n=1 Tax=Escallonia herrerae TaxID=1293975 RepID=A0AA88XD13_9ASTE|nr:hypothetical protein RJ639_001869 [Escallonia herrerae]
MEFFLRQLKLAYVLTQPCPTLPIRESLSDQVKAINDQIEKAGSGVLICLYADDMLSFGSDIDRINEAKNFLASNFSMKDLREDDVILGIIREADVILGIKIIRSQHEIVLTQSSYIEKILRRKKGRKKGKEEKEM